MLKSFFLLTGKPTLFACNVAEKELANPDANRHVTAVREYVKTHLDTEAVVISAQIESDLVDLSEEEQKEYLESLGVKESGVGALIRAAYHLLGLRTYFTTGEKETRAWTIHIATRPPRRRALFIPTSSAASSRPNAPPTTSSSSWLLRQGEGSRAAPHRGARSTLCRTATCSSSGLTSDVAAVHDRRRRKKAY